MLRERNFDRERPLDLYLRQERPRRVHAPGAVSSYSNYGAALAGEAASYAAGKPFERLVEDEIFTPLGLRRTTFRRELQQVCVELGLGCEIDERTWLLTTRVLVLVRGTREGVDALVDYARVSGWSTWPDDGPGGSSG